MGRNQSTMVVQDGTGFLWFSDFVSLTRFDGYDFKVYIHDPDDSLLNLGHSPIGGIGRHENLVVDPDGTIWLNQTMYEWESGYLLKHDRRTDGFIRFKPDLKGASIHSLHFDRDSSLIWLGTVPGRGLISFDTETGESKQYLNSQGESNLDLTIGTRAEEQNAIFDISDRGLFFLLATWRGLWKFDKNLKTISRPNCDPKDSALLYWCNAYQFYNSTRDKTIWVAAYSEKMRLVLFNLKEDLSIASRFDFPHGFDFNQMDIDNEGVFWIATQNGLYRYDPSDGSLVNMKHVPGDPFSIGSDVVSGVIVDHNQNVWVATDRGIDQLPRKSVRFYNTSVNRNLQFGLGATSIMSIKGKDYVVALGGGNNIWIGPLHLSDSINLQPISFDGQDDHPSYFISSWRGKNNLWIATYGRGVIGLPLDETGKIRPRPVTYYSNSPENPNSISYDAALSIYEDSTGNIWVGTFVGLNKIVPSIPYGEDGSVTRYSHDPGDSNSLGSNGIHLIYPENDNAFWLATFGSVDLFSNGKIERVFKKGERVRALTKAKDGTLYIGTDRGMFVGEWSGSRFLFTRLKTVPQGVLSLSQDKLGRIWAAGSWGLACYDPKQDIAIQFAELDGIVEPSTYGAQSIAQSKDGIMVFKGFSGISVFDPLSVKISKEVATPVLTGLQVNNKQPAIAGRPYEKNDFILPSDISVLDELILDYSHNNFAIQFAAMELTAPDKNLYKHKLEEYDNDWIESDGRNRTATYTNLDAGDYLFKVRASNSHGVWSDHETTLIVRILPPPWKTWWAYALYGAAFVAAFIYWRRYENKRLKLKHRAEHLSELDTLKTQFFANISHEFRTPITLILGPLKDFYNKANNKEEKTVLGTMMRNGQRLLRLINQLLDLSKLEAGKMQMHANPVDLVQFLREITSSYESLALDKKIKYLFYPEELEIMAYIDEEKIEKVIHNLLSNAFKFTKEGGEVVLYVKVVDNQAAIVVKDTGIGISTNQLNKVFDRFYQVDNSQTRSYEGSGIGMALAKELVEAHHGKIAVESIVGKGTTFTVLLPLGKEHLTQEDLGSAEPAIRNRYLDELILEDDNISGVKQTTPKNTSDLPVLLVVEDNTDMRNYICKTLAEHYEMSEAINGKEGLKKAQETLPDLIISDIMMPEMDGFKLCQEIKSHELTSHIPVILLTAKADHQSRMEGLETRADDYLSKPFDADELKLIIRNRIEERRALRERFSREVTLQPRQICITSMDEQFLSKVLAIIEKNMDNELFSIDELSREVGYSNMHFYRKIKALAGQPPSQFVRTIRLKRAAELLAKNSDNVSQIAYSVGFSSLSYFNKCFKEQFGVTPGKFAEEKNNA
jgi:signal transduction histidine kinase/DNA-binding response OmpR family regulator